MNESAKKRILILINRLAPGGAPTRLLRILELIDKSRFDVSVCAFTKEENDLEDFYKKIKIKVIYLHGRSNPMSIVKLFNILRKNKYDILHTVLPFSGIIGRPLGKILGVPGIASSQETIMEILKPFTRFLEGKTLWLADVVTFVSESVKNSFKGIRGGFKRILIYNAVNIDEIDLRLSRAGTKQSKKEFIICNVGRLEPVKDQYTLIRAFESIADKIPNAYLWIIGWGHLEEELKQFTNKLDCKDRIKFFGKRRDVIELLNLIDVFVLPSTIEGLAGALLEAMAARKPVIVSNIPQNLEVVTNEENGLVFECGDYASLASMILKLYTDPKYAAILAGNGRKRIEDNFSLTKRIHEYEDLYQEL